MITRQTRDPIRRLEGFIFWSRWLQAPLYVGLIAAQGVYVYQFMIELAHLITRAGSFTATETMLVVLGLIDVVMISNLLLMVIVGGYETFVSRLDLEGHPDQPEWLSHVSSGVLKVKLATAIIGISAIHFQDLHRGRARPGKGDPVAGDHPPDLRVLGVRDGLHGQDHDEHGLNEQTPALILAHRMEMDGRPVSARSRTSGNRCSVRFRRFSLRCIRAAACCGRHNV